MADFTPLNLPEVVPPPIRKLPVTSRHFFYSINENPFENGQLVRLSMADLDELSDIPTPPK